MEDFANLLSAARTRAGLTQTQLASEAGLTPSYLSFLERRKKPPPSDDVCRRLAAVLKVPERSLLDVAHLQRAPETLRKKFRSLTHLLTRERKRRSELLRSLLSPFLPDAPLAGVEALSTALSLGPRKQRRLAEVLAAVGRRQADKADDIAAVLDELPERQRAQLLDALPGLLSARRTPPNPAGAAGTRSGKEPALLYAPPDDRATRARPYLLEAPADALGGEIRAGDVLLVDPVAPARPGDLLVLRGEVGPVFSRVVLVGDAFRLERGPGKSEEGTLDRAALERRIREVGAGIVVEIRRTLPGRRGR
ncbi:MAG: helix-turn-helix domain-containing protein [Planctomycetota bacterium]